jgi:hypothetical protein
MGRTDWVFEKLRGEAEGPERSEGASEMSAKDRPCGNDEQSLASISKHEQLLAIISNY